MKDKPIIKLGAGKGKLIHILQEYLQELEIPRIENLKKLVHRFEKEEYILEVTLLRWEDIKKYSHEFDMIIYGSDQWLESGHKSMISLKYFEQENCRISLMVREELKDMPFEYFKERKIATSYVNLAKEYLGVKEENIVKISGSVEAATTLGWADSVFDVIETGKSAKENGLIEYKNFVKFGAILATKKAEKIQLFESLGLIKKQNKGKIIAFDGLDGSGKSTLAKYLVQNPILDTNSTVLITPYSGCIGVQAKSLWDAKKYFEWATIIGKNHWRAPEYVNSIYDRSILTFITDLIDENFEDEKIIEAVKSWKPLPDILFLCDISPEIALERSDKRTSQKQDQFDELKSLGKYHELYEKAGEFVEKYNLVKLVRLDVNNSIEEILRKVEENLISYKNIKKEEIEVNKYSINEKKPEVEGKSKKIYKLENDTYFMCFKPHLRSITSKREENIEGTDRERLISNMYFMNLLESKGIKTQIKLDKIETINGQEGIVVKKVKTIPIEFICRYYAAGSIVRLYPSLVIEGQKFKKPLYKFDLKQDIKISGVDDPTLNENYIVGLEILSNEQFQEAKKILAEVGEIVREDLERKDIKLIDMKMEMGFDENNNIIIIDEISQDCIRANDMKTNKSLTKDAFRELKSDKEILECYKEFNKRLNILS